MSPFEALYGRKCSVPVNWKNPMDRLVVGLEMLQEMEQQVTNIKHNLKITQDIKESCAY